jgi:hypothetical protein
MASLKPPSTALYLFFRHSIYDLYYFEPEKKIRLAKFYAIGGAFNLAILIFLQFYQTILSDVKYYRCRFSENKKGRI